MNKTNLSKLIGSLVVGALVIGALTFWLVPQVVQAQGWGGQGANSSEAWRGQGNGMGRQSTPNNGRQGAAIPGQSQAAGAPGNGQGQGIGLPSTPSGDLSDAEIQALTAALDDEYHAWAIYDQVLQDMGQVRPFASILRSEESHIAALVRLFELYDLEVPANPWPGQVPSFDTVTDACAASLQAEVDNAGLYEELFDAVDNPDVLQVFSQLQRATETRHLPAFQRCAP